MKKFVICTDYKAGVKLQQALWYEVIEAENIVDAMAIADSKWDETVYLMQVMEKAGKTEKADHHKVETYSASICRRSGGWHPNRKEYSEMKHNVKRHIAKYGEWFETELCLS